MWPTFQYLHSNGESVSSFILVERFSCRIQLRAFRHFKRTECPDRYVLLSRCDKVTFLLRYLSSIFYFAQNMNLHPSKNTDRYVPSFRSLNLMNGLNAKCVHMRKFNGYAQTRPRQRGALRRTPVLESILGLTQTTI